MIQLHCFDLYFFYTNSLSVSIFHLNELIIEIATEFNRLIIARIQIIRVLNVEEDRYYILINIKEEEIDVKEV